ncbi:hypothetical protein ELH44_06940 [Rhizobium ruizarguesonis]|uniref:hypothetical protein n=1 Tax=Rhizobium ruizarguesonis TaxID=2081791 RepID=UPI00103257DC|nr:hypothetical protein [Rhizobium ruizarguesonis]TBB53421.1 hypothetical protein ELH44_06940 [Rhizobium ruizarguesonis]
MRRYLKSAGIVGAVVAVAAIFVFPVWQAWVYQFQTLITGVAAVGAAFLTIRQSQRAERNAERRHQLALDQSRAIEQASEIRHRQLLRIGLRPNQLKVSRSVEPFLPFLEQAISDARQLIFRAGDATNDLDLFALVGVARDYALSLGSVLQNPQIKEAYELFEGNLANDLANASARANDLLLSVQEMDTQIREMERALKLNGEIFTAARRQISELTVTIGYVKFAIEDVRDGFNKLKRQYLVGELAADSF